MPTQKLRFQRVPLDQVPSPGLRSEEGLGTGNSATGRRLTNHRSRSKRDQSAEDDNHAVGLWLDLDILRKHQSPTPRIVIHDSLASTNNRYLALADLALRNSKTKRRKEQWG